MGLESEKGMWRLDHAAEHSADFHAEISKLIVFLAGDIKTVFCKVESGIRFAVLTITIRQLADEVCFVSALRPSLTQIQTD